MTHCLLQCCQGYALLGGLLTQPVCGSLRPAHDNDFQFRRATWPQNAFQAVAHPAVLAYLDCGFQSQVEETVTLHVRQTG